MSQYHHQSPSSSGRPLSIAFNGWFWEQEHTGSGQYLVQLVRSLVKLPVEHSYTVYIPAWRDVSKDSGLGEAHGIHFIPLRTPFDHVNRNLAKLWFEQVAVPAACRRADVDLLHVPYWATPAFSSIPVVTTIHDLIPVILPAYRRSVQIKLYTWLVSRTASRSALILTDSQASHEDICREFRLSEDHVRVVYLGIESQYQPVENADLLRAVQERYSLPQQFILYLGGFDVRKNVPILLRAYRRLRKTYETFPPLVIAGKTPKQHSALFPDPRREAAELGIAGEVYFPGWIEEEDKPALYSLATCFVFPSTYEGFGLPVLEAMACGTPVVTSNSSSLGELAGDGGVLVNSLSDEELAGAIETLVCHPSIRAMHASRALLRAHQFHWEKTAQLTVSAYRDVLAVKPANASQPEPTC